MPFRSFSRDKDWLFPPSLEELIPPDHPARFVAQFVESLKAEEWKELGIDLGWRLEGAAAYHPVALLCVWLYGFMVGVRSSRKLEVACHDQLPFLWLTGWQHPDHNTLWRFYRDHRQGMRKLFGKTVRTAASMGLVDLAVQAVDGTRVAGNASRHRTLDGKGLEKLLARTEEAIADLEAQNRGGEGKGGPPRLPETLARKEELKKRVEEALAEVKSKEGPGRVNLTDPETELMKGRQGMVAGYNAQAVVSGLQVVEAGGTGRLITAEGVVAEAYDYEQAVPMLEQAEENTGQKAEVSLLDAGYHSGLNLEACREKAYRVLMAESQERALKKPYHKDRFEYDAESDSYTCPEGKRLSHHSVVRRKGRPETREYFADRGVCRACPAFGQCTKDKKMGRTLEIGPYEEQLRRHRELMKTEEAKAIYAQRKELVEPVFGLLKELQGARRFLLRGLENVRCEWALLTTAFNLKTLCRVWLRRQPSQRALFFQPMAT